MATETTDPMLQQPVDGHDHTQGLEGAEVTLVEYGDYQSSGCRRAHEFVVKAQARLGDRLRFTFRHFAMSQVHPQSQRAAEAAEAAGSQGKFWEMHGALFAHQGALGNGHLVEYADALGLDTMWFLREVTAHIHTDRIHEQLLGGISSGVDETPTFFVNGVRLDENWSGESLLAAVEHAAVEHAAVPRP
jgi:protein-disulfide isomerase